MCGWLKRLFSGSSPAGAGGPAAEGDAGADAGVVHKRAVDAAVAADAEAAQLAKLGDHAAAIECRLRALELLSDEAGGPGTEFPWLTDFAVRQHLETARSAERLADSVRDDDESALGWWRKSAEHLGRIEDVDSDRRDEIGFLFQKVLGEAAAASYRLAAVANDADDAAKAGDYWDQASRLAAMKS